MQLPVPFIVLMGLSRLLRATPTVQGDGRQTGDVMTTGKEKY